MNSKKYITYIKSEKNKIAKLLFAFFIFWTPVILFSKIASEVLENEPVRFDKPLLLWLHSIANPTLDNFFIFCTTVAGPIYLMLITIAILIYLGYKKQKLNVLFLIFGVGGAAASNFILKLIFHRSRPSLWDTLVVETDYSFPSGHSMISMALITCIVIMLWNTRWRRISLIAGSLIVLLIGVSRLYLGVHYPTDVLAGWSIGFAWVVLVLVIVRRASLRSLRNKVSR